MKIRSLIFLFTLFIGLIGCYTERISNQNLSYLYDRNASFLHPEFNLHHKNDSVTQLQFRVNSNDLLYLFNTESGFYSSEFRLRYEVYTQLESKLLTDSLVVVFKDSSLVREEKTIVGTINLKPSSIAHSLLKIDLVDLYRSSRLLRYFEIDRSNVNCRQFFKLKTTADNKVLARNYLKADENVIIEHASSNTRATVKYYNRVFPLPKPPFSVEPPKVFDQTADSTFIINLNDTLSFLGLGFYHVQISDSVNDGFTIYRFKETFPQVKDVEDLIGPLRFLTSNNEYKEISEADFPKAAVDRFWLELAGNPDRAKLLIQKFYSRVENANIFFTSYLAGWQTDRGLAYIVFGPPNAIYRNTESEYWIYGEESNPTSLGLTFYKVGNSFTDNDYRLDRSPIYKSAWYNAVDMWREGRVYIDN
ncbi:GWxTD domain-containing protein [Bacteroidota bacterium]